MDSLIFYAFLLALFIAFLIEGQRRSTRIRTEPDPPVRLTWKARAIRMLMFVGIAFTGSFVIAPVAKEYIPGVNTGWVVSFATVAGLLMLATKLTERLGHRRSHAER